MNLAAVLLGLCAISLLTACAPQSTTIDYRPVQKRFSGLPKPGEQLATEPDKCNVRVPCAETAKDIATGIAGFSDAIKGWFLLWCVLTGVALGATAAIALKALHGRRVVRPNAQRFILPAGVALAFAIAYFVPYRAYLLPIQRRFVASDWLMKELKQGAYIPENTDVAVKDVSVNCVDRIQDVLDGRIDGCDLVTRALEEYPPLYSDIEPLDARPGSTTRIAGLKARADDAKKLLTVQVTWDNSDRSTALSSILSSNETLARAVSSRVPLFLYLPLAKWFPLGHALATVLGLLVSYFAVLIATRPRK